MPIIKMGNDLTGVMRNNMIANLWDNLGDRLRANLWDNLGDRLRVNLLANLSNSLRDNLRATMWRLGEILKRV